MQYRPEAVAPRERRVEPAELGGGSVEPAGVPGPAGGGGGGTGRARRRGAGGAGGAGADAVAPARVRRPAVHRLTAPDGDGGRRRPAPATATTATTADDRAESVRPRPSAAGRGPAVRRRSPGVVKVAVVVQRYGAEINGGAELHARYVAEHLARHVEVEVLTTCARDYISWANEYPAGASREGAVHVHRFPVSRTRDRRRTFGAWSKRVFDATHSLNDELAWLDAEGPTSPALVRHLADAAGRLRLRAVLQPALLPRVPRRPGRARQGDPGAHRRARRGARAGDLQADPARRARLHVQLAGRARAAAGDGRPRRRAGRGRRRRLGDPGRRPTPIASASAPESTAGRRSTSAASTRTRAAPSCSTSGSATARSRPAG